MFENSLLVLSGEPRAVPGTRVDLPVRPAGRRDKPVGAYLIWVNATARSSNGDADLECAVGPAGSGGTVVTARGLTTLKAGYTQLSFAGFYLSLPERSIDLKCQAHPRGAPGRHEIARASPRGAGLRALLKPADGASGCAVNARKARSGRERP